MTYAWLMAPYEYEPDYDLYWRDLESLEEAMADVANYDDWFPDQRAAKPKPPRDWTADGRVI